MKLSFICHHLHPPTLQHKKSRLLTFSTLWIKFSRRQLWWYFSNFFHRKQDLFRDNLYKMSNLYSEKNKKKIFRKMPIWENPPPPPRIRPDHDCLQFSLRRPYKCQNKFSHNAPSRFPSKYSKWRLSTRGKVKFLTSSTLFLPLFILDVFQALHMNILIVCFICTPLMFLNGGLWRVI